MYEYEALSCYILKCIDQELPTKIEQFMKSERVTKLSKEIVKEIIGQIID